MTGMLHEWVVKVEVAGQKMSKSDSVGVQCSTLEVDGEIKGREDLMKGVVQAARQSRYMRNIRNWGVCREM